MNGSPATALDRLLRRLQLLVGVGRVTIGDDSGPVQMQQVQLNDREIQDGIPRIADYGFTSMPKAGCHALLVFVGGERSNGVIVGTNDEAARLKGLEPGEVAIYDDEGKYVWLKRGLIEIGCNGVPLNIINASSVMHDGVNIGKTHTHPDPQGGNTGGPQ